ncbi:MAG: hypothetical protein FWD67_01270 [Betaproteobacteria bacterium]|nr:hypothetical protein [Betaproteobacteria bacterium]
MPVAIPTNPLIAMFDILGCRFARFHEFRGELGMAADTVLLDDFCGRHKGARGIRLFIPEEHRGMVDPVLRIKQQLGQFAVLWGMAILARSPL